MDSESKSNLIPGSIIVAGLLIAGAVVYTWGPRPPAGGGPGDTQAREAKSGSAINVKPVTSADHILGNPQAPVKVIEFSDLECPFCKRFHPTMKQIIEEYGKDSRVAWVYRHFPLDSLHSRARKEAEASECAAELGGNEKFWAYIDRLFEVTPSNNGLDPALLPQIAYDIGLNRGAFESCLQSGRHGARVEADVQDAIAAGGTGTPYSVVITGKGYSIPISGALPFANVKSVVEEALKNI